MKAHKHPKLDNGQPVISCFNLNAAELYRRINVAHQWAEQRLAALPKTLTDEGLLSQALGISRYTLWNADFPVGLKLWVCDNQLFRVAADLPSQMQEANNEQPLDFWDYGYVADVLRELLQELGLPKGDKQNLRRALAWAEDKGSGLRNYALE